MNALFLIPGFVCLFLGCVFLLIYRHCILKHETIDRSLRGQTWGKLVDTGSRTEYDYDNRAHTVHFGIYEYDTADGQHVSSASDFGYYGPEAVPGTRGNLVKIRYNPEKPAEFALTEEQAVAETIWPKFKKTGKTLIVIGILLTVAAVAALLGLFDRLLGTLVEQA